MHLGMPECHKPFLGHCDLDLWPSFQELLCPEHISYIIWCRNPKFGVVIPLGMAEWCIQFWVILTLTLTSGFISRFFLLYYSYFSSNVSCARPIPLGAFVTCLWHFLLNWKCDKFDMLILKPCTNGSTGFPRPWRITKGLEVRFESTSLLPFFCKKQASIIRKFHDQTLNTIPRHHEGEPQNIYISKTSARQ